MDPRNIRDFTMKNTNMPKFLVKSFLNYYLNTEYRKMYEGFEDYFDSTDKMVKEWKVPKKEFKLKHLKDLFGRGFKGKNYERNLLNAKVFRRIIDEHDIELITKNPKIKNKITYMQCLKVYRIRLLDPALELTERIQSKGLL